MECSRETEEAEPPLRLTVDAVLPEEVPYEGRTDDDELEDETLRTGDSDEELEADALVPDDVPDVRLIPVEVSVPVFLLTFDEDTPATSVRLLPEVPFLLPKYVSLPP